MAAPVRVMHILGALTGGGAQNLVCSLAPLLEREGAQVAVMTLYPGPVPFTADERSRLTLIDAHRRGRYDLGVLWRMVRAIRDWRPDIVHTHMHNGKYWGRLAAFLARVPVVVHTDHLPCREDRNPAEKLVDRLLSVGTARYIAFLEAQRNVLAARERVPPQRIEIILNGIHHGRAPTPADRAWARSELELGDGTFAVFIIGRLCEQKNHQLAIRAAADPQLSDRDLKLVIVGSGEDEQKLRALAHQLHVSDKVHFTGFRADAKQLLAGADVVFMPSLFEGMPLALVEAMGAGIPVITTPWIGAAEFLQTGALGTILSDWQVKTAAKALLDALEHKDGLHSTALKAQEVARERYDITTTAQGHLRMYGALAHRSAGMR